MRISKILALLATVLALVTVLTACGGSLSAVSSVGKFLNEDYDLTDDVFAKMEEVSELSGYALIDSNDEFAIFANEENLNASYKIYSMQNEKVIATIAENNVLCTFALTEGIPAVLVTKTTASEELLTPDVSYILYDAMGNEVAKNKICDEAPYLYADQVVYNYTAYTVGDNGTLVDGVAIPEYAFLNNCTTWNDDYFYVENGNSVVIYDRSFETVCAWTCPSYANHSMIHYLNDGNVLIQYSYLMDGDATKYDYYDTNSAGITEKADLVSLILSAKKGTVKEIDLDYVIQMVIPNYDLYDDEEENNEYTDKFENIAVIAPIEDKKLNLSEEALDLVLMNNKGKAQKSLKITEEQDVTVPTKIGEDLYLVDTLYGAALINGKGKLIKAFYNAFQLTIAGDYFIGERAIYDLNLEVVYNLAENSAEVEAVMADTVFVRKELDDGYEIISFHAGEQKTVYTENAESKTTFAFSEEADYYSIYNSEANTYEYYNANGSKLATVEYALQVLCVSDEHGTVLCWNGDAVAPAYVVLIK